MFVKFEIGFFLSRWHPFTEYVDVVVVDFFPPIFNLKSRTSDCTYFRLIIIIETWTSNWGNKRVVLFIYSLDFYVLSIHIDTFFPSIPLTPIRHNCLISWEKKLFFSYSWWSKLYIKPYMVKIMIKSTFFPFSFKVFLISDQ